MDRHHLLSRLAGYFQVVWMTQPGWRESLSGNRVAWSRSGCGCRPPCGSFRVYEPEAWLPRIGRPAWLAHFASRERLRRASDMLRARGCTKIVLFVCQPEYGVALEDLPHDFSIYYVSDRILFTTTEVELSATERKAAWFSGPGLPDFAGADAKKRQIQSPYRVPSDGSGLPKILHARSRAR